MVLGPVKLFISFDTWDTFEILFNKKMT